MPIASPARAMLAGPFGGSGSHIVQIIIGIVVGAALIGYLLWRIGSRRPTPRPPEVAEGPAAGGPGDPSPGEATLRLSRVWSGLGLGGQAEPWDIVLDGRVVGSIANQEIVEVSLAPGRHTLRLGHGRHRSPQRSFAIASAGLVSYRCHGPRFWPLWLAAMIKPDLWITLRAD